MILKEHLQKVAARGAMRAGAINPKICLGGSVPLAPKIGSYN